MRMRNVFLAVLLVGSLRAQIPVANGSGGIGDAAAALGDPASSYALSGLDHVNYYNGSVNFTIPLTSISGRGTASSRLIVPIQRQWTAGPDYFYNYRIPSSALASYMGGFYTGGTISVVTYGANFYACYSSQNGYQDLGPYTTYLIWTAYDGTQTILTDVPTNGQPQGANTTCDQVQSGQTPNRGRYFHSTDGSNLSFVASSDVLDGETNDVTTGVLLFPDGTRYSFTPDSYVHQIEDRNGNLITFGPFQSTNSGGIYSVTDPANRPYSINITEDLTSDTQDILTYPGFTGNHAITVNYSLLQQVLSNGESLQTYQGLFPEMTEGSSSTQFNPYVISSIVLADGHSYALQYNSYGEVTRLQLPTGGVYTYRYSEAYSGGSSGAIQFSDNSGFRIARRLQERDEYADGVNLSGKTVFTVLQSTDSGGDANHPARATIQTGVDFEDPAGNVLRREVHSFYGNPRSAQPPPSNSMTFAAWWQGLEYQTDVQDSNNYRWQSQARVYRQRSCTSQSQLGESCTFDAESDAAPAHDPEVCQVTTTLESGQFATTLFQTFDQFNNFGDKYEYDYSAGPNAGPSCPASAPGNYLRHTNYTVRIDDRYWNPNYHIVSLPYETKVLDGAGNQASYSFNNYDEQTPQDAPGITGHDPGYGTGFSGGRGNLTSHNDLLSTNGSLLKTSYTYDIAGNVLSTTDANNNLTTFSYGDRYSDNFNRNTYAHVTGTSNAKGQTTSIAYDYNSGKMTAVSDLNQVTTLYSYNDIFDRLMQVKRGAGLGSSVESQTNYQYSSDAKTVTSYQDQTTTGDQALQSATLFDGFGRQIESDQHDSSNSIIASAISYDAMGRVSQTTSPSHSGDGLNYPTKYAYDVLGRLAATTTADGLSSTNAYAGNQVTTVDQAGVKKLMTYDALGHLTAVVEDPNNGGFQYATTYGYDPLDDLVCVNQGLVGLGHAGCASGSAPQVRLFQYDSLSRLISAGNPESGTTTYDYYANGNLFHKVDSRGETTTFSYDALNRPVQKDHSDGSASITYSYDSGANGNGHLTGSSSGAANTTYAYDAVGNTTSSSESVAGQTYTFSYSYNLTGALRTETYPSGRMVTMSYDLANRINGVTGSLNGGPAANYVYGVSYYPFGATNKSWYGNQLTHTNGGFNSRLQPTAQWDAFNDNGGSFVFNESSIDWGDGTHNNNGTVRGLTSYAGGPGPTGNLSQFGQSFTYDSVNRLRAVTDSGGYGRTFNYDPYGNMAVSNNYGVPVNGLTPQSTNSFNASTNRIVAGFDNAGNQTSFGNYSLTYDAEGRMVQTASSQSNVVTYYYYDAFDQRVAKQAINGPPLSVYVYDAFGSLASEYSSGAPAGAPCRTCYLTHDHLGSVRVVTNESQQVVSLHDYLPFGEEVYSGSANRNGLFGATDMVRQRFTGQERDGDTLPNLDFFQARYFSGEQGRFLSPDPENAGADPANPQSWNGYAYVLGNPMGNVDPTGACTVGPDGIGHDDEPGDCGGGSVTVPGGPPDPLPPDPLPFPGGPCLYALCYGGIGNGGSSQAPPPPPPSPMRYQINPPKTGTSICAGYGTVCFPTTAPTLQPVNWKKFTMYLSCLAGTPPELMAAASGSPQDVTDSTPETQGRTTVLGYTPGKHKNGGQKPLNPSSAPEIGEAAANAPSYLNNVLACSAVVANMK